MALNTYPYSPFPASTEQIHKGDNEDLQAQIDAIKDGTNIDSFGDVETALDTKADNDVIAPEFDAEAGTYEIGDKVMYEGKLYEFTSAHETAGEWDPTEVTETTVADELSSLESGLNNLIKTVTKEITISSGDNKIAMLGINTPNVVLNISIAGLIVLGYSTYQNQWLCTIAEYDGTPKTSGTYTATIYYI